MKPLDGIPAHEVDEDIDRVAPRLRVRGIRVDALPVLPAGGIQCVHAVGSKQPVRVRTCHVRWIAWWALVRMRPDEEHVDPSVDAHAERRAATYEMREWVKAFRDSFRARLDRRSVIRIAPAAHLRDEIEDAARRGVREELIDGVRGGDPVADDPGRLLHNPA